MPDTGKFFEQKVERIRGELDSKAARSTPAAETPSLCSTLLSSFSPLTDEDIKCLIGKSSKKSCSLDLIPTPLVVECLDVSYLLLEDDQHFSTNWEFFGYLETCRSQTATEETQL